MVVMSTFSAAGTWEPMPTAGAALVAALVVKGSGIRVPKPRAGIAPDPLLRALFVLRRLSLSAIVAPRRCEPGGPPPATVADRVYMSRTRSSPGREQQVNRF